MPVTYPDDCYRECGECGGELVPHPDTTKWLQVDEDTGEASVALLCIADCQNINGRWCWQLPADEFLEYYGHPLGDYYVPFPDVDPIIPIPHDAWWRCRERRGLLRRRCGGLSQPDPSSIYGFGFNHIAYVRSACDTCGWTESYSWEMTDAEYRQLHGYKPSKYEYRLDPEDPDDFVPTFSFWQIGERHNEVLCRDFDHLVNQLNDCLDDSAHAVIKDWDTRVEWAADHFMDHYGVEFFEPEE